MPHAYGQPTKEEIIGTLPPDTVTTFTTGEMGVWGEVAPRSTRQVLADLAVEGLVTREPQIGTWRATQLGVDSGNAVRAAARARAASMGVQAPTAPAPRQSGDSAGQQQPYRPPARTGQGMSRR